MRGSIESNASKSMRVLMGISVVIADSCPVFVRGLMDVPHSAHTFEIVASCCDGMKSLQAIQDLCPNIALLDSSMSVVSGIEILATVSSERCPTRILLTATVEEWEAIAARSIGARGVIPKDVQPEALVRALRQVAAGARLPWDAFRVARRSNRSSSVSYHAEDLFTMPTGREREIANLVSQGLSNKEIGRRLELTAGTIKVHLHNIFAKLAINNRSALTALAVHHRYKIPHGGG